MRILFPFCGTRIGGTITLTGQIARELARRGHEPLIVAPAPLPGEGGADAGTHFRALGLPVIDSGLSPAAVHSFRGTSTLARKLRAVPALLEECLRAREVLTRQPVDIVHINTDRAMFSWGVVARALGIPVIWHLHQISGSTTLDRCRTLIATRVIAISKPVAARVPGLRPPIIPNGVDLDSFVYREPRPSCSADGLPVRLGFLGNLMPRKRPEWAVRCTARLLSQGYKVSLDVAGADYSGEGTRLQAMVDSLGVTEAIRILGQTHDVRSFLETLDVLLVPSVDEPFGMVILEAMASGVVVVAADSGGIPEIINHKHMGLTLTFNTHDFDSFVQAVAWTVLDAPLRRRLAEAARKRVEDVFSVSKTVDRILDAYASSL